MEPMTSDERFLEYCASNPECPYGSDEKWAAKLGWDVQERYFQSRIATLEAIVKAGDELHDSLNIVMEYLHDTDELGQEYLTPTARKEYDNAAKALEAYRQAKEGAK